MTRGVSPVVAIVGRPNVGKSTLFNRLCGGRRALMSPVEGTTRDWLEGSCHWNGRVYRVIDTGGYAPKGDDILASVRAQVERWIQAADLVLWVVDGNEGLTPADSAFAKYLRPLASRVVLVMNKADDARRENTLAEFYRLGFSSSLAVSASHGRGMTGLLDLLESRFSDRSVPSTEEQEGIIPVAIVGRPNVGKSSLVNRLLGEERMIVSPQAGTTRDSIDTQLRWKDRDFLLIDTAGLRSKKSKADDLEGLTRLMTERALERAQVAVLLVDATEGFTEGDVAVGRLIDEKRRACVVGVNKWDLVENPSAAASVYQQRQSADMPFMAYASVLFFSAKTGHHTSELMDEVGRAHDQFHRRFDPEELKAFFWGQVQERPYSHGGRKLHFYGMEQVADAPPTFVFRSNMDEKDIHFSFQRRMERVFRNTYGITSTPLVIRFRRGRE